MDAKRQCEKAMWVLLIFYVVNLTINRLYIGKLILTAVHPVAK